ncbi:DUF4258 domain-containing protein [Salisaeta longa]|uniref:DUF4258 domain-containing protein n=1 Tax=Salisaeta longa TaxID=503170 RepID=UPI0003B70E91|nr:DUF4258 domain-containing protein [Salisaeta longa]
MHISTTRWTIDRAYYPKASGTYRLSSHAITRMYERQVRTDQVVRALRYGRVLHTRGAVHFVLGRKEVQRFAAVPATDNGVQVVVAALEDGTVLTCYRNPDQLPRC